MSFVWERVATVDAASVDEADARGDQWADAWERGEDGGVKVGDDTEGGGVKVGDDGAVGAAVGNIGLGPGV